MRFAVGQRPEPSAENVERLDLGRFDELGAGSWTSDLAFGVFKFRQNTFVVDQTVQARAPLGRYDPGGMIGKSCQHGNLVSALCPVAG